MADTEHKMVQCPHCGANNRVPADKPLAEAKCGKCHQPLRLSSTVAEGEAVVLRCTECGTKNRVRSDHLDNAAKCGKCGAELKTGELFVPQPIMISDRNFTEKVLKSPLPVLVYAMTPTCPSCRVVGPQVDAFAKESKGKIRVGKVNIQISLDFASKYNILGVPYLLVFDKGKLVEELPGGLDKSQLMMKMAKYIY